MQNKRILAGSEKKHQKWTTPDSDGEPLVSLAATGEYPETRWVRGSNRCVIGLYQQRPGHLIISSVIDNLVKGEAGQAIQNMNLMLGFNEFDAIPIDALSP